MSTILFVCGIKALLPQELLGWRDNPMDEAAGRLAYIIAKYGLIFQREPLPSEDAAKCTLISAEGKQFSVEYSEEPGGNETVKQAQITLKNMIQDIAYKVATLNDDDSDWDYSDEPDPNEEEDARLDYALTVQLARKLRETFGGTIIKDLEDYIEVVNMNLLREFHRRKKLRKEGRNEYSSD